MRLPFLLLLLAWALAAASPALAARRPKTYRLQLDVSVYNTLTCPLAANLTVLPSQPWAQTYEAVALRILAATPLAGAPPPTIARVVIKCRDPPSGVRKRVRVVVWLRDVTAATLDRLLTHQQDSYLEFTTAVSKELAAADTPWAPCPLVYKDSNTLDRVCVRNPPPGSAAEPCHSGGDSEWVAYGEELAHEGSCHLGSACTSDSVCGNGQCRGGICRSVPGAPTIRAISRSALMTFSAPTDIGNAPLIEYNLLLTPSTPASNPISSSFPADTASPHQLTGLVSGTRYTATLAAENEVGTGPDSEPVEFVFQAVPDAPTISSITPASLVTFAAAAYQGTSPIQGYTLELTPTSPAGSLVTLPFTGTAATTTYQLAGLTGGTVYSVRLQAANTVGSSAFSAPATFTHLAAPGAPTISSVNSAGLITFAAPANDGGSPITGYTAVLTPTSPAGPPVTIPFTGTSATTTYQLTSLTGGTAYSVKLQATNAVGSGPFSAPAAFEFIVTAVPGAPTISTVSRGGLITFAAPANPGSSPITSYTAVLTPTSPAGPPVTIPFSGTSATTTYQLTSLTDGTAYSVTLKATNAVGSGPASAPATFVFQAVPDAPTISSITPAGLVTFAAAAYQGTSPVQGYTIELTPTSPAGSLVTIPFTGTAATTTYQLAGLTGGTVYSVRLQATNAVGSSAFSAPATFTHLAVPGAPTISSVTPAGLITFAAPANDGGSPITGYTAVLTPTSPAGPPVTLPFAGTSATTTYQLTSLMSGTAYSVTIVATNAVGTGPASAPATFTCIILSAAVPDPPTISSITSAGLVTFAAAANQGSSPITSYSLELTPTSPAGAATTLIFSGTAATTTYQLTSLTGSSVYSVRLQSVNSVGASVFSAPATFTAAAPLPACPPLTLLGTGRCSGASKTCSCPTNTVCNAAADQCVASCLNDLNCSDPSASYCDPTIGGGCVPKSCNGVPACLDSTRWGNNQCNRCWSCATALCSALPASGSCDGFGNCLT